MDSSALIQAILTFLASHIPYVGQLFVFVTQWGGLIAGLFTSLSVAIVMVLRTPELLARWAGASALADQIKAFSDEVIPWFKYLSIFNAQVPGQKAMLLRHEEELNKLKAQKQG